MNALQRWRAAAVAWWGGLAARERRGVSLAAAVLGLFAVWALAVAPAWRTLRAAPAQIAALDAQLAAMQRLAAEAQALRATPPLPAAQATQALQAASAQLGGKARLALQGERAVLTLTEVPPDELQTLLGELRTGARARPVEATLTRGAAGYSGQIVVATGGGT